VRDGILEHFKRFDRDRHLNQLCADDLDLLKKWRFDQNLTRDYGDFLTVQGWNDLKYMAIDYQRTFQHLIEPRYASDKFKFGYTDTQRTEASFKAFVEGLFGPNAEGVIEAHPESNRSILLRPYELCDAFQQQADKAKDKDSEYVKFMESEIYKKTAEEISTRLGYKYTLNHKQIDTMWDMCRFDQAWYLQDESPWCAAFTPEHVNVLEYLEDLKYYYKAGYGSSLNSNIMCAAVKDMVRTIKSEENPKVVAYFTHASAIQLFLTALGYAKDTESLRADNFNKMKYRKFRSSTWSPFASNLAVVKYE
jgi:multiple inositol-polyphosphate phosphatase / 2,3-bisphosphoglycerate 3-phosphatase